MSGFFPVDREWRDNPIFRGDYSRGEAWLWLLENACWKPTKFDVKGRTVLLERGQLCASRDYLAKVWGWSSSAVERFLTRLQTEQMIGRETGQGKSVITISNYPKNSAELPEPGQETGQATGQRSDRDRTAKEQGNKGIREEEPNGSPSQGAGASEGDEAGSDDLFGGEPPAKPKSKSKRAPSVAHLLPEDWEPTLTPRAQAIVDGWPPGVLDREEFKFRNYHQSRGNKMKDWDAAFRTWIGNADDRNGYKIPGSGFGAPAGSRFQPEGGIAEGLRRIELARNHGSPGETGRWDDHGPEGGYLGTGS